MAFVNSASLAAQVTVSGRQLRVDGQPFTVRGVSYNAVPVGSTGGAPESGCANGAAWWVDTPSFTADFPLIRQMGANTIRTYDTLSDTSAGNVALVRAMLDKARNNGLYVIMGLFVSGSADLTPGSPARMSIQNQFLAGVDAYKDHPAVLMWVMGNEQNLYANGNSSAWFQFVNQTAGLAKSRDPNHAVMVVEGEVPTDPNLRFNVGRIDKSADDASLPNVDVWGFNSYRGATWGDFFSTIVASTTKPVLFTEFGKDAYRDSTGTEDGAMQAEYLRAQWGEISANLSASDPSKPMVGGVWFEWSDEWWKGSGGTCLTHDPTSLFSRSGDPVDPIYNEEWFGLVSIRPLNPVTNPSGTSRTLRASYTAFQRLWAGSVGEGVQATGRIFSGTVRNFPNPFRVGYENSKFVVFTGRDATIDVKIFDAGGQHVVTLSGSATGAGRTELSWNGRTEGGALVSPGLYIARIEGRASGQEEKQFRRVVAVK